MRDYDAKRPRLSVDSETLVTARCWRSSARMTMLSLDNGLRACVEYRWRGRRVEVATKSNSTAQTSPFVWAGRNTFILWLSRARDVPDCLPLSGRRVDGAGTK